MPRFRFQQGWVEEVGKKVKKWRGHYFVYVQKPDGTEQRKHRIALLGTKSEMRKFQAEKKLKEIIEREVGEGTARPDETVTLNWFWENRFIPLQAHWRDSTRLVLLNVMKRHFLSKFGGVRLCHLNRFDLQKHLNDLARKYSKSLVKKVRTWGKAIIEEAVEQRFLSQNPARKLTLPPTRDTCKRFLTIDEYHRMLDILYGRDRLIFRLFVIGAFRPGELFALRWRCFEGDSLRIEEAVYRGKIGKPKTRSSAASVILPESLAADLRQWYEDSGCPNPDAFIFPSAVNKPIDGHNYLQRDVLQPAAESIGINGVTFQSLRRTFATHFHRVGTVKDQQAQMRHSNAQTTMDVYTQIVSDSLRAAMKEFDEKMSKDSEHK
jgi:integrase